VTERQRSMDELALIEQMRELRQSERAPDAFREQLSARLLEAVEASAPAAASMHADASEGWPSVPLAPGRQRSLASFGGPVLSRVVPGSSASMAAWLVPLGIGLLGIGAAAGHFATRWVATPWVEAESTSRVPVDREPSPRKAPVSPLGAAAAVRVAGEQIQTDDPAGSSDNAPGNAAPDTSPPNASPPNASPPNASPPNARPRADARDRPRLDPPPRAPHAEPTAPVMASVSPIPHWQLDTVALARGGAVVARGRNLVTNGDFRQGAALWSVRVWNDFEQFPATVAPHRFVDGALCVTLRPGEHRLGGWPFGKTELMPHSFELAAARPYRLSLRAWTSGPLAIQLAIKIGAQFEPYTQTIAALVPVTAERQSFTVDFTAPHSEPNGGISWLASAAAQGGEGELCVDDISVTMR
jgi:hypothetical protein